MAAGDVVSCTIESLGFAAQVVLSGLGTGGTFNFGYSAVGAGAGGDPANAKMRFTVTSQGYDANGNATTIVRTVYGSPDRNLGAMRKVYPDQATADVTYSSPNTTIRVALSDFIYASDTVSVAIDSGWYTQGGTPSNATSGLGCTNSSSLAYPKVLGGWAMEQRRYRTGTSLVVEFIAFHKFAMNGKQVACVKFTASDGTNSATATATAMSVFSDSPLGKIVGYQATLDLSGFTDLAAYTVNAIAYPWVGDSDACLNTGDGVNTFPTRLYTTLAATIDKNDVCGKTCVDATNGNDSTGTVYATQAAAEAGNAFLTIAAALTALATYNNTNAGHNNAGGSTIYLKAGAYSISTTNGGTLTRFVTIANASGVAASAITLTPTSSASSAPTHTRYVGLTFVSTSSYRFNGSTSTYWIFSGCTFNVTSGYLYITASAYSAVRNCTGVVGANTLRGVALLRGNDFSSEAIEHSATPYVMIGNKSIMPNYHPAEASSVEYNDGCVCAYNRFGDYTTTTSILLAQTRNITKGFALVQNLVVRFTTTSEPIGFLGGDSNTATSWNILQFYNTTAGGRVNEGYNDTSAAAHYHTGWADKNNMWGRWNNKDDTFYPSANGIGAWPVGYAVGRSGCVVGRPASDEWLGESSGLYYNVGTTTTPVTMGFVDDQSVDGGNTSGGDYHLLATSPGVAIAKELLLPYDFEGVTRVAGGAAGVYEYVTPTPYSVLYDANGAESGTVPVDGNSYGEGYVATVLGNTGSLARSGYLFDGWNTSSDGSGTHYDSGASLVIGTSDVTLYAEWFELPPETYLVNYYANGADAGSVPVDHNRYENGDSVTALGNSFELHRFGHTFNGWNTSADGTGTSVAAGSVFSMGASEVNLYAQWTGLSISVDMSKLVSRGVSFQKSYVCAVCSLTYKASDIRFYKGKPYCISGGCANDIPRLASRGRK